MADSNSLAAFSRMFAAKSASTRLARVKRRRGAEWLMWRFLDANGVERATAEIYLEPKAFSALVAAATGADPEAAAAWFDRSARRGAERPEKGSAHERFESFPSLRYGGLAALLSDFCAQVFAEQLGKAWVPHDAAVGRQGGSSASGIRIEPSEKDSVLAEVSAFSRAIGGVCPSEDPGRGKKARGDRWKTALSGARMKFPEAAVPVVVPVVVRKKGEPKAPDESILACFEKVSLARKLGIEAELAPLAAQKELSEAVCRDIEEWALSLKGYDAVSVSSFGEHSKMGTVLIIPDSEERSEALARAKAFVERQAYGDCCVVLGVAAEESEAPEIASRIRERIEIEDASAKPVAAKAGPRL